MTRKKSNVKALALAVTCAILAGGGIGLKPVYAADVVTYNTSTNKLIHATTTEIDTLTVGGVTIDGSGTTYGITIAKGISAANGRFTVDEYGNIKKASSITTYTNTLSTIGGVQFKNNNIDTSGTITASKLVLSGGTHDLVDVGEAIANNKAGFEALNNTVGDNTKGLVKKVGDLETKTTDISYNATTGTTVGGVTFNAGAVSGVTSINSKIEISDDGSTVTFNKGVEKGQVQISESGIKVGTGSTYVSGDAVYTGGVDYANAKAGMKNDGSLKATGFAVDGATGDTTVGGNLHANKNAFVKGMLTVDGNIEGKGALKGKTLGIGTNGSEFTVDENGAVNAAGGKVKIDENGNAQFGDTGANITKIEGNKITTGRIETSDTLASNIGGVTLQNGQITAKGMTINGAINLDDLTVKNKLTVGDFVVDKTGVVTGLKSINGVTVANSGTGLKIGSATIGDANPFSSIGFKVDNVGNVEAVKVTAGTITDGNGFTATGGNVTATGTVQGKTIYDGVGAKLENGKITANEGKIGNVEIKAGVVTGVNRIEAQAFKVDDDNYLNSTGIKANSITAKGGTIGGAVIDATTLTVGVTKLDSVEGITTHQLKIRDMTLTDKGLNTGDNKFEVNGVEFKQGQVTAMPDKGFVAGNSSFKQGSLIVDDNNKLEATNGLTTEKATVKGNLDVIGKATFGTAGKQTTIDGDAITTDTLKANKLILGASGDTTVEVNQDGSLKAADGKFEVDKDGALKAANGAFNVDKDGKTTFKKDADNLSSINGGNIWAKATDADDHTSSELLHTYKGLHVSGTQAGKTSAFDFNAANGIGTFTGQDGTTTAINGSAITSTNGAATGVLNGSNLTLDDGTNSTALTAGGATFTKDGKTTIISGDTITTGTLNVKDIVLGGTMYDATGQPLDGKLSIGNDGHLRAANGNFDVKDDGTFKNTVGNTTLNTDTTGASMKFNNTAAEGGVTSEVTVEANKATVAAGENASFVATTNDGGTATITGGTQTVTTTGQGTVFKNSANNNAFVTGGATTTIINGNEITTGKITTDQLVIKGNGSGDTSGDGGESGSIAFGGDGTITSNIKDGANETTFKTTADGVSSEVNNGTYTSNVDQSAGRIDSVITGGNVKLGSVADASLGVLQNGAGTVNDDGDTVTEASQVFRKDGSITSVAKDADGKSSNLVQNGTGLTYTDSAKPDNATRIDSGDVSIGAALDKDGNQLVDDGKEGINRINLSDLGQIDNLDAELKNRPEYKNGEEVGTAVGAINAEAGIRREEVARLDNRIDDVNDRVDKVGAMAAAIASLKSIGYDPQAPSEFSIGLGQYKGETGVAMGFFHYPNKNFMINVSLSTAGGETMGGIGATWRFGHKSPQKLLEEQREAQAKKELAAAEKYQAAAKLAKEAQERAEYAAKLARQAQVSADNAKAAADATQAKHFG